MGHSSDITANSNPLRCPTGTDTWPFTSDWTAFDTGGDGVVGVTGSDLELRFWAELGLSQTPPEIRGLFAISRAGPM
jgi:hypothetical protein